MKNVTILPKSHGHWTATTQHRGKTLSATIADATLVDDYNDKRTNRERGYAAVCKRIHDAVMIKQN
jgi:hypothetical protein